MERHFEDLGDGRTGELSPEDVARTQRRGALRALEQAVKQGTDDIHNLSARAFLPQSAYGQEDFHRAADAYHGSLNAAYALMKNVLPGFRFQIDNRFTDEGCTLIGPDEGRARIRAYATIKDIPARAWLLAIVRALIAIEEAKDNG